jgi:hypothetical protein
MRAKRRDPATIGDLELLEREIEPFVVLSRVLVAQRPRRLIEALKSNDGSPEESMSSASSLAS